MISFVRVMPNTPIRINYGATAISFPSNIESEIQHFITKLFNSCGITVSIPESQMDVVTALSGSGFSKSYFIFRTRLYLYID